MSAFSDYEWTLLTLPPRHFSWRIRGNSLSWAFQQRALLEGSYDLLIATSMVDLSALRGFVPALARIPTLVYFHENQFSYPESGRQFSSVEPKILNLYTALAADSVAFNSAYNRDSFLQGADALLAKMPDEVPAGLIEILAERSAVLPVPIAMNCFNHQRLLSEGPLQIVWNHRWEYDKAPERLFAAIKLLLQRNADIQLHVIGQQFRQLPAVFAEMKAYLQQHYPAVLKQWGFIASSQQYRQLLQEADVVVSTALHEFQGLAVMEAVAAGCVPVVPNRLSYPEWFKPQYCYPSSVAEPEREARDLADHLQQLADQKRRNRLPEPPDILHLSMDGLKDAYRRAFKSLQQ